MVTYSWTQELPFTQTLVLPSYFSLGSCHLIVSSFANQQNNGLSFNAKDKPSSSNNIWHLLAPHPIPFYLSYSVSVCLLNSTAPNFPSHQDCEEDVCIHHWILSMGFILIFLFAHHHHILYLLWWLQCWWHPTLAFFSFLKHCSPCTSCFCGRHPQLEVCLPTQAQSWHYWVAIPL